MRIYLIAGEPSGDLLGSRLMRAMRRKDKNIEFYGVGGDTMEAEGLKSLYDISDFRKVAGIIRQMFLLVIQTCRTALSHSHFYLPPVSDTIRTAAAMPPSP